ncbi:MAG: universal stress protein, partial [Pseudomonadota bacterium]
PADRQAQVAVTAVLEGNAAIELLHYANHHDMDLIVMSSFGQSGGQPFPHGGVTLKLLSQVDASVMLVTPGAVETGHLPRAIVPPTYGVITVAVDATQAAEAALQLGVAMAQAHGAVIRMLDAVVPVELPDRLHGDRDAVALARRLDTLIANRTRRLMTELKAQLPPDVVIDPGPAGQAGVESRMRAATLRPDLVVLAGGTAAARLALLRDVDRTVAPDCARLLVATRSASGSQQPYRSTLLPADDTAPTLRAS